MSSLYPFYITSFVLLTFITQLLLLTISVSLFI